MVFIVEAGELIKIRYNIHNVLREFRVEAIIVEAGEDIKIRNNFQSTLREF